MSLPSSYNPSENEHTILQEWVQNNIGSPEAQETIQGSNQHTYSILMPPPNVTGNLHAGHAFQHYLMDTLTRIARQEGKTALWYPGVDHAGIQLEGVIDKRIKNNEFEDILGSIPGYSEIDVEDLPKWLKENHRDKWLECAWEKVNEWRNNQKEQAKVLGDTPDYTRQLFTLDERATQMVMHAFRTYWEDGLIYKKEYLVNWSVGLQTALSDFQQDVEWVEQKDPFVTFEYIPHSVDYSQLDESLKEFTISYIRPATEWPKIQLSTVRIETKFTDLAVAMHPDVFSTYVNEEIFYTEKEGYEPALGQKFIELIKAQKVDMFYHLPSLDTNTIKLIIDDEFVEADFGTGIVKVTPGHDPHDYDMYKRFVEKGLLEPNLIQTCIDRDGKLNEYCKGYEGQTVYQGRIQVVYDLLKAKNIPVKDEYTEQEEVIKQYIADEFTNQEFHATDFSYEQGIKEIKTRLGEYVDSFKIDWNYSHNVLYCERSKTQVEPLISEEFFLSYHTPSKSKGKTLLQFGREGVDATTFHPEELADRSHAILDSLHDWCISRNLVWGHQIPIWYNEDINPHHVFYPFEQTEVELSGQTYHRDEAMLVQDEQPTKEGTWVREEKILDTWFSSCLWPLTTLDYYGYSVEGKENTDFERYYQTDTLTTGTDILYAWILRMITLCNYWTGKTPFKHLVVTPTILDEKGKKMSKSLGNGLDPVDQIERYSSDALRLALLGGMIPHRNMKMGGSLADGLTEKYRNFGNKMWNIARFLESKETTED